MLLRGWWSDLTRCGVLLVTGGPLGEGVTQGEWIDGVPGADGRWQEGAVPAPGHVDAELTGWAGPAGPVASGGCPYRVVGCDAIGG